VYKPVKPWETDDSGISVGKGKESKAVSKTKHAKSTSSIVADTTIHSNEAPGDPELLKSVAKKDMKQKKVKSKKVMKAMIKRGIQVAEKLQERIVKNEKRLIKKQKRKTVWE
jgi:hypothetical protein